MVDSRCEVDGGPAAEDCFGGPNADMSELRHFYEHDCSSECAREWPTDPLTACSTRDGHDG